MIFKNGDHSKLPDSKEIGRVLSMLQSQAPVQHLMPLDRVVDDDEAYILTRLSNGRCSIKPNITHQGLLYYGNSNYDSLSTVFRPSYYRAKGKDSTSVHDDFLEYNVLAEQFRLLIESFPLYELLNTGIEIDSRFSVRVGNPAGLASAYGLRLPFVNMTSDIDVAMFYATHYYDKESESFKPAEEGTVGIVYVYSLTMPFGITPGLSTLGKQVFPRTFYNRQFMYAMQIGDDFNKNRSVNGFTFRQTSAGSEFYGKMFENGELLVPKSDFLMTKWKSLENKIFRDAIRNNLRTNPKDDEETNCKALESRDFVIVDGKPVFTYEDIFALDLMEIWNIVCDELVSGVHCKCDVVDYLEQVPFMDRYKRYFNASLYYER